MAKRYDFYIEIDDNISNIEELENKIFNLYGVYDLEEIENGIYKIETWIDPEDFYWECKKICKIWFYENEKELKECC